MMSGNPNSPMLSIPGQVHRLEGRFLRRWWQIPKLWGRESGPHLNLAMQKMIELMITLPIIRILALGANPNVTTLDPLILITWLCAFSIFLYCGNRHLRHVVEVSASNHGLRLKSWFRVRNIGWAEIIDYYEAGNGESGNREYVLACRNGDRYFLSKDLTDSDCLIASIKKNIQLPATRFDQSIYIDDGVFDLPIIACFALVVAALFGPGRWLLTSTNPSIYQLVQQVLPGVAIAILPVAFCWLLAHHDAQILRIGDSVLYIETRTGSRTIPLERVTSIFRFGFWTVVRSHSDWFVVVIDKKEPAGTKLLELQSTLPLLNRRNT